MKRLIPHLVVNPNPDFYFNDIDYTDYRELVCFERPACFILHYYFGFPHARLWLFDRFLFELGPDKLFVSKRNALADFLKEYAAVKSVFYNRGAEEFSNFASHYLGEKTGLVVQQQKMIGDALVVSSILLEGTQDGNFLCTSLRGDDFYIAKPRPEEELAERLFYTEGTSECFVISFSAAIQSLDGLSNQQIWDRFGLAERFDVLRKNRPNEGEGGLGLEEYLESLPSFANYSAKVEQGFGNVLLAQAFWPMLFAYSPFVVFLRSSIRAGITFDWLRPRDLAELERLITQIGRESEIVTNLGLLFGKQTSEKLYERFKNSLTKVVNSYAKIEEIALGRNA